MKTYKARGVVLHTIRYGDSAVIAYVLTDRFGRQNYLIRGMRSGRKRTGRAALFQPMFLLEFEGVENPRSQLHQMREVRLWEPLRQVPFDVRKSTIALFMAEVLYKLVREVEPDEALFDFVTRSIRDLDAMETGIANFHLWFLVRLSAYLGFYPGGEYVPGAWFDIVEGYFTPVMPEHRMAVSQSNSRLLDELMRTERSGLADIALGRAQRDDFLASLLVYYGYHLEAIREVQSIRILREVF